MDIKSDPTLFSQQGPFTAADLNAMITSNATLVKLLEQINTNLEPLKEIKILTSFVKEDLVTEVVQRSIIDKQLDITNEQSKLARTITENTTLLKAIGDKLTKAIWVLVLCVSLLGGISVINNFLNPSTKKESQFSPIYHFDREGHGFVMSGNDTLWISSKKP